ncbi:hypothetical protein ACP70R_024968 [Stipagrostis hirtigluma subsp. patula]
MMPTRRFCGGDGSALTGLRLRRLVSFLKRHRLYDTAHALERQTGVFFDAEHLRRMLRDGRWPSASSYALRFFSAGDCSLEADMLIFRILLLRVMADLAGGQAHADLALFQRLYASLRDYPDGDALRRLLLSMRSDVTKASSLYQRIKPKAVEVIMDLVAKCPELKTKTRLPRCTVDPTYIMSLGPGMRVGRMCHKNKAARIPAHVLASSFLRKRPHLLSHKVNHSDVPSAKVLQNTLPTSARPANLFLISSTTDTESSSSSGLKHSRHHDGCYPESSEQVCDSRMCTKRLRIAGQSAVVRPM